MKREKSTVEFAANPKVRNYAQTLAETGSVVKAAEEAGISPRTASNWNRDRRFHLILQEMLERHSGGLEKAGQILSEALIATKTRIDKNSVEIREPDWTNRLRAINFIIKVYGAYPQKGEEPPDNPEDIFADIDLKENS